MTRRTQHRIATALLALSGVLFAISYSADDPVLGLASVLLLGCAWLVAL